MTDIDVSTSRRALLSGALGLGGIAALAPAGTALAAPVPVDPSSDFFLDIAGVAGESTDEVHQKQLEPLTWAFGVSSVASPLSTSGGAGASKSKPTDFTFVARTSKASPKLYQLVCTGRAVKTAVLTARRRGETPQEYLTVTPPRSCTRTAHRARTATRDQPSPSASTSPPTRRSDYASPNDSCASRSAASARAITAGSVGSTPLSNS